MMRHRACLLAVSRVAVVALSTAAGGVGAESKEPIVAGHVELFESLILGESRALEIFLPAGHDQSEHSYPLLVVLDGGAWFRYLASLQEMIAPNHLPEMIVVGLPNTARNRDLNVVDESLGKKGAGAERFTEFLEAELFPYLAREYRASSYRILAGHSLAASFVLHTLYTEPELFRAYLASSPPLYSGSLGSTLGAEADALDPERTSGRFVFLSAGGEEGAELEEAVKSLAGDLESRAGLDLDLGWQIYPGEGHIPIQGFYQGLRRLFVDWFPPREDFIEADWPSVRTHYEGLSRRFGFLVPAPVDIVDSIASRLLRDGKTEMGREALRYLVGTYPSESWARTELAKAELRDLRGPYLGQAPPGLIPQPFADFLAPTPDNKHSSLAFSADGREVYFSVYQNSEFPQRILVACRDGEGWSIPEVAAFSGQYQEGGPVLSADGQRLFFYSKRPLPGEEKEAESSQIWVVDRQPDGDWSEPRHLPAPISSENSERVEGFTGDGQMNLIRYIDRELHLFRSSPSGDGGWSEPELVRTVGDDEDFFRSVDMGRDDFYIFGLNKKAHGPWYNAYLYISYRQSDGNWTVPKSMGDMINRGEGRFPSLSPDGKYLFFTSYREGRAGFYWVDSAVIDYLREHDLELVNELTGVVLQLGLEAALQRFEILRIEHSEIYQFDHRLFDDVANELIVAKRIDLATAVLRRNRQIYPDAGSLLRRIRLAALEEDDQALRQLKIEALEGSHFDERRLNSLGRFLVRSDFPEPATRIFELELALRPWSSAAHVGLATVFREQGDIARVHQHLTQALELDPGNKKLASELEELLGFE